MQQIKILLYENETLRFLMLGVAISNVIIAIPVSIFSHDRIYNLIGLLIGFIIAEAMSIHMAYSIEEAIDYGENGAQKKMRSSSIIRYVCECAGVVLCAVLKIGDPIFCILGIFTLKLGVYIAHPLLRYKHRNDPKAEECLDEQAVEVTTVDNTNNNINQEI